MSYRVVFSPEAEDQLAELFQYIAQASSPERAAGYTEAIVSYCESLRTYPHRGMKRDDIRPGIRITNYRKRAVIAFAVEGDTVSVLGVFYGGRDYETLLSPDQDD